MVSIAGARTTRGRQAAQGPSNKAWLRPRRVANNIPIRLNGRVITSGRGGPSLTGPAGEEVAAAYTMRGGVSVEGRVGGEVGVVFGRAEAEGVVGGDVRVLFGDVRVGGTVGGSVEVGFGDVVLEEGARVGGDVIVGVGTVNGGRFGRRGEYHPRSPTGARVAGEVRIGTITNPWALQEAIVLAAIVALLAALGVVALYVKTTRRQSRR